VTIASSIYNHKYVQAEHAVDHGIKISTFQNGVQYIKARCTRRLHSLHCRQCWNLYASHSVNERSA